MAEDKKGAKEQQQQQSKKKQKRFVGVRQRPSGRWVAEIKDSTQKLRLWLGTFDNAEDAARAYDDAARALRGANTRTNFKAPSTGRLSGTTRLLLQRLALRTRQQQPQQENQQQEQETKKSITEDVPEQHKFASSFDCLLKQRSVYGAFIEKIAKVPLASEAAAGHYSPSSSSFAFQDGKNQADTSQTNHGSFGNEYSSRFMSTLVKAPPTNKYRVAPSIHVYPASSCLAPSIESDEVAAECQELMRGPSICGSSEPPAIVGNDDAVSPKSADSSDSLWLSYFDQTLCAVS